jgi:predicted nucleotidyltransferase
MKFNQRGIAKMLNVSPPAVAKALPLLEKEGLVKFERGENINLNHISFNRDNPRAIQLKRVENLRQIYESGLFNFLFNEFPGCSILLFGSYSRGEDVGITNENRSDIDIAVIGAKGRELDLSKFNNILRREVIINFYESWKFIHKHLKRNILGGIMLNGSIEL